MSLPVLRDGYNTGDLKGPTVRPEINNQISNHDFNLALVYLSSCFSYTLFCHYL